MGNAMTVVESEESGDNKVTAQRSEAQENADGYCPVLAKDAESPIKPARLFDENSRVADSVTTDSHVANKKLNVTRAVVTETPVVPAEAPVEPVVAAPEPIKPVRKSWADITEE